MTPTLPDYASIPGCWNAYVCAGHDEDEQIARYFHVPEAMRPGAWSHLQTAKALSERARLRRVRREMEEAEGKWKAAR